MKAVIIKHLSFILMLGGSGLYFLSSILAKKYLHPDDFYLWNALLTIIAISFSFVYLGSEQLFVRLGIVEGDKYIINIHVIYLMLFSVVSYIGFLFGIYSLGFFDLDLIIYSAFISIFIAILIFFHNLYRVKSFFNTSQLVLNSWKFFLLLMLMSSHYFEFDIKLAVACSFIISCLILIVFCNKNNSHLEFSNNTSDGTFALYLSFLFSLMVITLMGSFDRLAIEKFLNKEVFSQYVYLVTILIMPFGLVSSYFGFKEVVYFKEKFSRKDFYGKLLNVSIVVSILFSIWFVFLEIIKDIISLDLDFSYFIPSLLLSVIRCVHSIISSLFGVKAGPKDIRNANFIVICFILLVISLIKLGVILVSPLNVMYMMASIWAIRTLAFSLLIRNIDEY